MNPRDFLDAKDSLGKRRTKKWLADKKKKLLIKETLISKGKTIRRDSLVPHDFADSTDSDMHISEATIDPPSFLF